MNYWSLEHQKETIRHHLAEAGMSPEAAEKHTSALENLARDLARLDREYAEKLRQEHGSDIVACSVPMPMNDKPAISMPIGFFPPRVHAAMQYCSTLEQFGYEYDSGSLPEERLCDMTELLLTGPEAEIYGEFIDFERLASDRGMTDPSPAQKCELVIEAITRLSYRGSEEFIEKYRLLDA